jgi:hypothetical protein
MFLFENVSAPSEEGRQGSLMEELRDHGQTLNFLRPALHEISFHVFC